jgi:hypothetical protein
VLNDEKLTAIKKPIENNEKFIKVNIITMNIIMTIRCRHVARVLDLMLAGQTTLDQRIEHKQTITETRYICEYTFMYIYKHMYIDAYLCM